MIIEGRTIETLAELRSFLEAAERITKAVHPHRVRLQHPVALRLKTEPLQNGMRYEIEARV
jgi:hypothetical protein